MVEISGSQQPEDENKNTPASTFKNPVDSLVIDNTGGIAAGKAGQKGLIKRHVHKFWSKGMDLWPSTKRQKIIGGLIVAVLLIGGAGGVYALNKILGKTPNPPAAVVNKVEEQKDTEPSRLTGVEIPKDLNKRAVTAIMIENSPDARPQSGLRDAGIVFEAIAEGGITRFNALFLESQPDYIGPVRSVRPYYIDMFLPFDAAIAHAGGSGDGLAKVKALHVKDLDFLKYPSAYHRVSNRFAPHNLYTSMSALDNLSKSKNYTSSTFTSWPRKAEEKGKTPKATKIDFTLSGPLFNVHYDYDAKSNTYKRSEGGKPHTDYKTHKQLAPKVVVALVMPYSHDGEYSVYKTRGPGTLFVFQDGQVYKGKWKKGDSHDQLQFFDDSGKQLALDPGQTWVTLLASSSAVNYAR
jgi:hypothetical protein